MKFIFAVHSPLCKVESDSNLYFFFIIHPGVFRKSNEMRKFVYPELQIRHFKWLKSDSPDARSMHGQVY